MTSSRGNDQQSFLFVISGAPPMTLTSGVPEPQKVYCPGCIEEDGISIVQDGSMSWIGHAAKTIQRIIDDLRKRAPRATVTVVTLLGGIATQLQNVPIQSEEQIEITLESIESMLPSSEPSFTKNLHEYLTKMNPTSILKKSNRPEGTQFDMMFMFLGEEDLSSYKLNVKPTVTLAPLVRWFIIGPTRLRASLATVKRSFAPANGDFEIFTSEDMIAANLMNRLLPPPEKKPLLAFGTKSARFEIDPSSGVRSIEVFGFMPVANVSSSNLSQFSYEEEFIYDIGQDTDYVEAPPLEYDIDGDYFSTLPEPEQQLLPLLLNGMVKESLAAFCQVSLKENTEYLLIKQALATLEESSVEEIQKQENAMEIDVIKCKKEETGAAEPHLPVYAVLFATSKKGHCYEPPSEVEAVDSDEGPSDDDDIEDILDEEQGKTVRLTLALLSPVMNRPGWPEMEQWTTEVKYWDPSEKPTFWETDKYETKSNRWMDDAAFAKDIIGTLTKLAMKKDFEQLKKELSDIEIDLSARCMDPRSIDYIVDAVAMGVTDTEIISRLHALKRGATS